VHHADAAGPICGLNTNGRRLAHAAYVDDLAAAGLNHVQVTLGSHDADVHDRLMNARSFAQTVRGIENALASPLHVITNTTLTRLNAATIVETIDFLRALGIETFALNAMIHSGGGFGNDAALTEAELAPILVRVRDEAAERGLRFLWYTPTEYCRLSPVELEIGAKRCNAGEYSLCVEPDGSVLPCQSYYVSAGNLLSDPWESIWRGELFRSFRERGDDPDFGQLPAKCHGCPDLPLCGGGCRIQREAEAGVRVAQGGASCGGGSAPSGFVALADVATGNRRASGRFR
jgi:radical SAM protein with 4Fe4S-binding SPASM domain